MYSVVLATALMAGGETPAWHHRHHGGHGCHGCFSACHGCFGGGFGCHGCFGGGFGCYGCFGGGFGCHGCYASYGCMGCFSACHGCYGGVSVGHGCFGGVSACHGCFGGGAAVVQPSAIAAGITPIPSGNGQTAARLDRIEQAIEKLTDAVEKMQRLQPGVPGLPGAQAQKAAPAQITVNLPADAKLYVDDVLCTLTSSKRSFATPTLKVGQKYYYTLRVELTNNGQNLNKSQQVVVEAGRHVQVNFNPTAGIFTVKN